MKLSDRICMSNEDTLISMLIEETCSEKAEKDQTENVIDLQKYFEKRLNQVDYISIEDYFVQNDLNHQTLNYESKNGCYRLIFKQTILDFPSNWSIFNQIKNSDFVFVDNNVDDDFLLDIFTELSGLSQNIALVKEKNNVQLVFLSTEESVDHVNWMNEYFKKKNQNLEKTAA